LAKAFIEGARDKPDAFRSVPRAAYVLLSKG
jgi:hypothetical protein